MGMKDYKIKLMNRRELMAHYEDLKELATKDGLTGLFNRRELEQRIDERLSAMKEKDKCALFIIDLDNFKSVNDSLGHQCGDDVLQKTAAALSKIFRATDIVGRLGGDEFIAFICGNMTEDSVKERAQMICDQIQFVMGADADLFVTASVGIHIAAGRGQTFDFMYRSADLALYKAKKNGKRTYWIKMNTDDMDEDNKSTDSPVSAVQLKGLLDYIDSGVAMIEMGDDPVFVYGSPAFLRMVGVDAEKLVHMPAFSMIHPEDRPAFAEACREKVVGKEQPFDCMARLCTGDDAVRWWKIHAAKVEQESDVPVILITVTDVSEMKEQESSLKERNELFQEAIDQTTQGIWEVDFATSEFRIVGDGRSFPVDLPHSVAFPEELIRRGWISPESADEFRDFADELLDGNSRGFGNFLVKYKGTNQYRWVSFSYRVVFDSDGKPVHAVGVIESLNRYVEEVSHHTTFVLPEGMMSSLILHVKGNLSTDAVSRLWIEGRDVTGEMKDRSWQEIMELEKNKMFTPERSQKYPFAFSKDGLIFAHKEMKKKWMNYEYERVDGSGKVGWVSMFLRLSDGPDEGDVILSVWVCRLNQRRAWEKERNISIYKDPVLHTYARSTMRDMAINLMNGRQHIYSGLVMIRVSGYEKETAEFPDTVDEKWRTLVYAMMLSLGTACLPGVTEKNKFTVFFPEVSGQEFLKERLEQSIRFVRNVVTDTIDVSSLRFLTVGVCSYRDETEYDVMLKRTNTLYDTWGSGLATRDRMVFADENADDEISVLSRVAADDQIRIPHDVVVRPLACPEKHVALEATIGMLNADSLEESCAHVLRVLGEYYDADRTYIMVPLEHNHLVAMPHEWTAGGKTSMRQAVSGTLMSEYPMLCKCALEQKPLYLSRHNAGEKENETWRFAIFPMWANQTIVSYLCIENAHNSIHDSALVDMLSSCLLRERQRYKKDGDGKRTEGTFKYLDLPNLRTFLESIHNFNSDVYRTLGVVSVDVPKISELNSDRGFGYGRKLIWYVAQTLAEIFGKANLYRTWDAEFIVLCPNVTQQIFFGKCNRFQSSLTRRYPNEARIGFTWAEGIFQGKNLVEEAKAIMSCYNYDMFKNPVGAMKLPPEFGSYASVGEMITAGLFTVYLQPKVNMETGEICGAESLIRGLDRSGRVIPPIQFVEEFEKNGAIRDLDLFVLDRTMHLLDTWKKEGRRLVPVSVNFSRVTLFDRGAPASVLAIQSRYPDIPPSMIEIEITESAGNISKDTLTNVMEDFRQFGVGFSLDDWGSFYSNVEIFTNVRFDSVKLDRSVVNSIADNEKSSMLVKEIVEICHAGGIKCIAEGVENEVQVEALLKIGCTIAQGYYYDRPLPAEQFRDAYLTKTGE